MSSLLFGGKMKFIILFLLVLSCKDDNCTQTKKVSWDYSYPSNEKIGFKIYRGDTLTTLEEFKTLNPSSEKITCANIELNLCKANYIYVTAFDLNGNESAATQTMCIGQGCVNIIPTTQSQIKTTKGFRLE